METEESALRVTIFLPNTFHSCWVGRKERLEGSLKQAKGRWRKNTFRQLSWWHLCSTEHRDLWNCQWVAMLVRQCWLWNKELLAPQVIHTLFFSFFSFLRWSEASVDEGGRCGKKSFVSFVPVTSLLGNLRAVLKDMSLANKNKNLGRIWNYGADMIFEVLERF